MDALAFRGIRYASSERFGPAQVLPFRGPPVAGERGPVSPQARSRLEMVMGPAAPLRQDEHCQVLSVFTPSRRGKRPVMVFVHGGAFITGGGELPWYDGGKLAAEGDIVVVTVTYRSGAFGHLHLSGSSGPSPGTSDQIAALEWVKSNIAAFGGDCDRVTVCGHSAGAFSIVWILASGLGGKLFHRAILQSGGGGVSRTRAEAESISLEFLQFLGSDPHAASANEIVSTQRRLSQTRGQLVDWLPVVPDDPSPSNVDIISGWTREDALPFALLSAGRAPGADSAIVQLKPLADPMTSIFITAARELAARTRAAGNRAWLYRFEWAAPGTGLGAPHCIELPFLLGHQDDWRQAPMLGHVPWAEIEAQGRTVRAAWASFVHGNAPAADWEMSSAGAQSVHVIPSSRAGHTSSA